MTTSSMSNVIKGERPAWLAVTSAIKADVSRFANALSEKHVQPRDAEWPDTTVRGVAAEVSVRAGRDLLADYVDPDTLQVIDAALACHRVRRATAWGVYADYVQSTTEVVERAADLAGATCSDCADHLGVAS